MITMNNRDKDKLKVLIKMILIQNSPKKFSSNQLARYINKYNWGFSESISSAKIGKLLGYELNKKNYHFLKNIIMSKQRGVLVYYIPSVNDK